MRPLLWPRMSCRSSKPTPAARNRRPHVCLRSCTRTRLNPSGAARPSSSWYRAAARRRAAFQPELFRRVKRWRRHDRVQPALTTSSAGTGRRVHVGRRTRKGRPSPWSDARKPVVALIFPKSARENASHLDGLQVLGTLETELGGDAKPHWCSPFGRERLPIEVKRQNCLRVRCAGHVDAGRIPIETSEAHKGRAQVCSNPLKKRSQRHPAPASNLAPSLDADVPSDLLDLRQRA